VALARSAGEEVAPALELQLERLRVEADAAVGPVDLLLDDEVPPTQLLEGHCLEILIPFLEPRAEDVPCAGVLVQPIHRANRLRGRVE
jgi:hypothetical protein